MNKQFNWEDLPCSCSKNYTCNRCKNLDKKHLNSIYMYINYGK